MEKTIESTCLLDLEDDDDSSSCSSFTVASVLSRSKHATTTSLKLTRSLSKDDRSSARFNDEDNTACTFSTVVANPVPTIPIQKAMSVDVFRDSGANSHLNLATNLSLAVPIKRTATITGGEDELRKLRCNLSLMDESFDSDDDMQEENKHIMSPVTTTPSSLREQKLHESQSNLQKTVKKSNCRNVVGKTDQLRATNRDSIFRRTINGKPAETSTEQQMITGKTQPHAPHDDSVHNSFDVSAMSDLLYTSFDELDKEATKRRKSGSHKFLAVYDDLSAQAIQRSSTFNSKQDNNSKVKRMSDAFSTAVQSVVTSQAASRARCDVAGSWDVEDLQSLSGKKRSLDETSGRNLRESWSANHNYIHMQLLAEREEERRLHDQELKTCNAQIKYLQHENLTAYESVNLARTESFVANESKKQLEEERDALKKEVDDCRKESGTMKKAMLALAEAEKHRVKAIKQLEKKLNRAKSALVKAATAVTDADKEAAALREKIAELEAENKSLSVELSDKKESLEKERQKHNDKLLTAKKEAKKWQLQVEENSIEIQMLKLELATAKKSSRSKQDENPGNKACVTPNPNATTDWGLINAFGAEDVTNGSELFNQQTFAEKLPLQTVLMTPTDKSSRLLSYVASSDKENISNNTSPLLKDKIRHNKLQQKCCLCFKNTTGVMRSCQCGQKNCDKRAHATCLAKYKVGNISSCVSHPGTPLPPMPLILCTGIWKK